MKISIVTPCLNAEKFISETIESVVLQEGDFEIEYVVVDGKSTDKTMAIVQGYQQQLDKGSLPVRCQKVTMKSLSEKDSGIYDALAKGFKLLTGEIAAYINADDFYFPHAFSCVADVFRDLPQIQWVTGMPTSYNEKGHITGSGMPFQFRRDLIRKGIYGEFLPFIQQESCFWRRGLMEKVDFAKWRQCKLAGDFYLWRCFAQSADLQVIRTHLSGFRCREGQLSYQLEKYLAEVKELAEGKSVLDSMLCGILKQVNKLVSNDLKAKFNKDLISFRDGRWTKRA